MALPVFSWGLYGQLRKHYSPSVDTVSFTVIYVIGQALFTLLTWIWFGVNQELDLLRNVSGGNIAMVALGGFSVLFADFFSLAAAEKMSPSTASALYCIVSAAIGVPLDFLVEQTEEKESRQSNLSLLMLGTGLILSGLTILILAEYLIPEQSRTEKSFLTPRNIFPNTPKAMSARSSARYDVIRDYERAHLEPSIAAASSGFSSAMLTGCALGFTAGIFNSIWSVLCVVASSSASPFTSPPTILLVFNTGQLAALPFIVVLFGHFRVLGLELNAPSQTGAASQSAGAWPLFRVPSLEIWWALAIGCIVDLGYWGYFVSTLGQSDSQATVPASVAYALAFCDVLVSLYSSLFVFGDYGDWRAIVAGGRLCAVLVVGTACYVAGVCVLALQVGE